MNTRSKIKITDEEYKDLLNNNIVSNKEKFKKIIFNIDDKNISNSISKFCKNLKITKKKISKIETEVYNEEFIGEFYNDRDSDYECLDQEYNEVPEYKYFKSLKNTKKIECLNILKRLNTFENKSTPFLYRFFDIPFDNLNTQLNIYNKIKRLDEMNESDSNYNKLYEWLDNVLKIPFNQIINLQIENPSQFIIHSYNILNETVYGHQNAKNQIVEIITDLIQKPNSKGKVFGIQGPMGNGKTTLLKNGLAKVLNRPFHLIQLGGLSDDLF